MNTIARRRWGDNDHYFGPITFARDRASYRPLAVQIGSGNEDYPGASLRLSGGGFTVIVALPSWVLRPHRAKTAANWDAETVARLGRDWYWTITEREFGFTLFEGYLSVHFGRQTMDSSTEQSWGYFLPWTQWRHVRRSFHGLQGELVATIPNTGKSYKQDPTRWRREQEIADATPVAKFSFDDFDGERITATTRIEEREWRFGTGWFKWLTLFRAPKVRRTLNLLFSSEVGRRKGSWKGGTIGHAIAMRPGELHEAAFRRYCDENELIFVERGVSDAGE